MMRAITCWVAVGLLCATSAMDMEAAKSTMKSSVRAPRALERNKRQAPEDCGSVYTSSTGTIQSENYPDDYSNNHECDWTIRAPEGNVIELTFADPYRIEIPSGGDCYADELEIFDGGSRASRTAAVCGKTKPDPITTTTNEVYLRFHTDSSLGFPGFQINYRFVPAGTTGSSGSGTVASAGRCGQTLTATTGIIQSQNYPNDYTNDYQCDWTIEAPPGHAIELTFVDTYRIEIPNSSGVCYADRLEIRDGGSSGQLVTTVCGKTRPDPVTTESNVAFLNFETDGSLGFAGFKISYRFVSSGSGAVPTTTVGPTGGCGSVLTQDNGVVQSPNYPADYGNNIDCTWTIEAPAGQQIELTFTDYRIEIPNSSGDCYADRLEIFEGSTSSSAIATVCGKTTPEPIVSDSNKLVLRFTTDGSLGFRGFNINYRFTGGNAPPPRVVTVGGGTCEFTITAGPGCTLNDEL